MEKGLNNCISLSQCPKADSQLSHLKSTNGVVCINTASQVTENNLVADEKERELVICIYIYTIDLLFQQVASICLTLVLLKYQANYINMITICQL